jgi:hypothetical protein
MGSLRERWTLGRSPASEALAGVLSAMRGGERAVLHMVERLKAP